MNAFQEALWLSLPVPAFLLDPGDVIAEVNPEGESFLNASARSVRGQPVFDVLAIDAPLDDQFKRVRSDQSSLFMNNVDVGTGQAAQSIISRNALNRASHCSCVPILIRRWLSIRGLSK